MCAGIGINYHISTAFVSYQIYFNQRRAFNVAPPNSIFSIATVFDYLLVFLNVFNKLKGQLSPSPLPLNNLITMPVDKLRSYRYSVWYLIHNGGHRGKEPGRQCQSEAGEASYKEGRAEIDFVSHTLNA